MVLTLCCFPYACTAFLNLACLFVTIRRSDVSSASDRTSQTKQSASCKKIKNVKVRRYSCKESVIIIRFLRKIEICLRGLVKIPNIDFQGNPSNGSHACLIMRKIPEKRNLENFLLNICLNKSRRHTFEVIFHVVKLAKIAFC